MKYVKVYVYAAAGSNYGCIFNGQKKNGRENLRRMNCFKSSPCLQIYYLRSIWMKKLKDFLYNKNDIIIVLLIVAVAAFIIYTRIGVIMDYPEKLAKEAAATETAAVTQTEEEQDAEDSETISVTIEDADTAADVAQKLYDAGLIASSSEFEEYVVSSEKESAIKAGTYEIPISSLQEEILDIITE